MILRAGLGTSIAIQSQGSFAAGESRSCPADPLVNHRNLLNTAPRKFPQLRTLPHPTPHTPPHTVCGTDMWWAGRNASMKSVNYRNGSLPPDLPTYSSLSPYRRGASLASVHCVLQGSLLTTWLIKSVDVVASLGHCLLPMNLVGQGNDERGQWQRKDFADDLENKKMISPHKVASIIHLNLFCFCNFSFLQI